jgi:hypothetical protein
MVRITLPDGSVREYENAVSSMDVARCLGPEPRYLFRCQRKTIHLGQHRRQSHFLAQLGSPHG